MGDAVRRADTTKTRMVGLLNRTELKKGEGLWIVPSEAVHTFFMRMAIDVLFLDRKRRVVKLRPRMGAWRMAMAWKGRTVVELPPGTIVESGTVVGDELEIVDGS